MFFNVLAIFLGLFLLISGAELLVRGASNIAKKFHIPEILIGLTIVALGTSMPELFITVKSAMHGATDLIVGNSIGSDLCNLLLILGIMAIIRPIDVQGETKKFHIPIAFVSTLVILGVSTGILTGQSNIIGFKAGIFLIVLFILYIVYPIILDRKKIVEEYYREKEGKEKHGKSLVLQIAKMVIGIVLLKIGGDFVVDYASIVAESYGVSERLIGLTIVAMGTSLPELVTSIVATINGDADIAVGNLIGSSVLNSLLILGIGSVITPIEISEEFIANLLLLAFTNVLIWLFCYIPKKNTITRIKGFSLVAIFIVYIISLLK